MMRGSIRTGRPKRHGIRGAPELPMLIAAVLGAFSMIAPSMFAQTRPVVPVLSFPEIGLDDPAAYQGYQTRFFRDAKGNVVQVYLDARSGRVVNLLADAVNESVGFTVRDGTGKPLRLEWGSTGAVVSQAGPRRTIEYQLVANAPRILIGWILLGSMRVERDLQYSGRHLERFDWPTFRLREQEDLISNVERLDPAERQRHLGLINASYPSDLRARLEPDLLTTGVGEGERRAAMAFQQSLDAKTSLQLDLGVDPRDGSILVEVPTVSIRAVGNRPIRFTVRVTTDAPALTPLAREQIFNAPFLRFLADARARAERPPQPGRVAPAPGSSTSPASYYRQLERDVRGTELLSSKEKLMAGLPNYATYFGRDMMMTSLMMQPVWTDAMAEFVIASVLRKLGPQGDVSHEEALGGQAIRENATEYIAQMSEYFRLVGRGSRAAAATPLANARVILADLQRVRENYHMRDDEFQLPLVVARYLGNPAVSAARKRAFLMDSSDGRGTRIGLLMKEISLVATLATPYARDPVVQNLIASPRLDSTHWRSISWRDSNAGYANGRFAMDINAIWAPRSLQSIAEILVALRTIGFSNDQLAALIPGASGSALGELVRDSAFFQRAIENWQGAARHFVVSLTPEEIRTRVAAKLQSLPADERAYWQGVLTATGADRQPLEFVAISLDSSGRPIPVVNTDPATWLLLRDGRDTTSAALAAVTRDVRAIMRAYPVGLFVDRLGPLVANDAYASPSVWESFQRDLYHSPRVVWGREVNLLLLGLANQISGATDAAGRPRDPSLTPHVTEMRDALRRANAAVEASGMKHNELWSYEISGGTLRPIRYGASTDVQLWNVTDLAVQFILSRLPMP
jgi:hypothetical protein